MNPEEYAKRIEKLELRFNLLLRLIIAPLRKFGVISESDVRKLLE